MGEAGKNPVALHEVNGACCPSTTAIGLDAVSRVVAGETLEASTEVLTDVAGCNASAVVLPTALALQIDQRLACALSTAPQAWHRRNPEPDATSAYSWPFTPTTTFSGVTLSQKAMWTFTTTSETDWICASRHRPWHPGLGRSGHDNVNEHPTWRPCRHLRPSRTFGGTPQATRPSVAPRGLTAR